MLSDKQLLLLLLHSGWNIKAKIVRNGSFDFFQVSEDDIEKLCVEFEPVKFHFRIGEGVYGEHSGMLDYDTLKLWKESSKYKEIRFDTRKAILDEETAALLFRA